MEAYFLLELDGRISFLIIKGLIQFIMFSCFCDAPYSLISDKKKYNHLELYRPQEALLRLYLT